MERERKFIDKLLNIAPGGVYGILSVIAKIFCDFLAYLFFPGYNIFDNLVSDLGVGPGAIFFSLGLIISGILSIPFYVTLARSLRSDDVNEKMRKAALKFFYISDFTYILLGVFPSIEDNIIIYIIHGTLVAISIASGLGYLLLYSILMLRAQNFSKYQAYHGFIVAVLYATFLLTWIPIIEWVMNMAILSWITVNSVYILYLKKQANLKFKD